MTKNPKIIAFYLPQFYRTPENDEWWGDGFTDWKAARESKPLFWGHAQPRRPYKDYYYNLLEKSTLEWQADLARKAGIYGFCIYHYWFGDKQLLEKPVENLLAWKEIKINFCFSWANESWLASWSKLKGNSWVSRQKETRTLHDKEILIEQKYGDEKEWKNHFTYLLPFFKDHRYIKKDGKPIFVIYRPENIPCLKEMIKCWNKLAKENGIRGIYFIGTNDRRWKTRGLDAALMYEPAYTKFVEKDYLTKSTVIFKSVCEKIEKKGVNIPELLSYSRFWKTIIERKSKQDIYLGGFIDFDSSPRKGKNAMIFLGANPKKFYYYFKKLYDKSKKMGQDYIFLTAWNEWGEGAYLEPDKRFGVGYLNAIRKVLRQER